MRTRPSLQLNLDGDDQPVRHFWQDVNPEQPIFGHLHVVLHHDVTVFGSPDRVVAWAQSIIDYVERVRHESPLARQATLDAVEVTA